MLNHEGSSLLLRAGALDERSLAYSPNSPLSRLCLAKVGGRKSFSYWGHFYSVCWQEEGHLACLFSFDTQSSGEGGSRKALVRTGRECNQFVNKGLFLLLLIGWKELLCEGCPPVLVSALGSEENMCVHMDPAERRGVMRSDGVTARHCRRM